MHSSIKAVLGQSVPQANIDSPINGCPIESTAKVLIPSSTVNAAVMSTGALMNVDTRSNVKCVLGEV